MVEERRGPAEQVLASATLWRTGERPTQFDLSNPSGDGIRWFDLASSAAPEAVLELLGPHCDGLSAEMVEDLLSPDDLPEGQQYNGGQIRLASTFSVEPVLGERGVGSRVPAPEAGVFTYGPVELVANDRWLVTCWHPQQDYQGSTPTGDPRPAPDRAPLLDDVAACWLRSDGGNGADLGVQVMHELSLGYSTAHRAIYAALENWELGLYSDEYEDDEDEQSGSSNRELHDLWGARARMRDWLNPLNVPGLRHDLNKAWLPATDHDLVVDVDARVDRALKSLADLSEELRGAFHQMQIHHADAQRAQAEKRQQRIEIIATVFLIPTLIVGFYGANTWVPGQQRHWGFYIMVGALILLTILGLIVLRRYHGLADAAAERREAGPGAPRRGR